MPDAGTQLVQSRILVGFYHDGTQLANSGASLIGAGGGSVSQNRVNVALRTVSVGKERFLTCYCPLCCGEFKRETGLEPPDRTKVKWAEPVIDDDDPWLQWNIFRVRDCYADYTKSLSEVIGRTAPQVKLGSFVVKNLNPQAGLYACYHMVPCGAVSCWASMNSVHMPSWPTTSTCCCCPKSYHRACFSP